MSEKKAAYYEEELKKHNKDLDDALAKRKTDDQTLKDQINATVDKSVDAQSLVYEQEIEQAPLDSRVLYDQNAMQEAVNRKKISETLTNMGMTDSGLSSSMNTALAVQKSRADNQVRAAESQRIRAAQSAIRQIVAAGETQKASEAITIDKATTDWEREQRINAQTAANETATLLRNADLEAEATKYAADLDAQTAAEKLAQDVVDNRNKMAQSFINQDMGEFEATAAAYRMYPDTSTAEGLQYDYYNKLKDQGYDSRYAKAMAVAYANTIAQGGTKEQAQAAANEALQAEYAVKVQEDTAAANEATALKNQETANSRIKLAADYIGKGMDSFEAAAAAYSIYPDTSTAEGLKFDCYNQLRESGYESRYAKVMAVAYANTRAQGGTKEQAQAAANEALQAEYAVKAQEDAAAANAEAAKQAATAQAEATKQAAAAQAEATKRANTVTDNRAKQAQSYISKGKDSFEAWAEAYRAYPDTTTAEGYQYDYYNKLKDQGYDSRYAKAMAVAYVNKRNNGGSEEEALTASGQAMLDEIERELQAANVDSGWNALIGNIGVPKATASNVDKVIRAYTDKYDGKGLSETALNFIVAQKVGQRYADTVAEADATTVKKIKKALTDAFDGVYASVALSNAGLRQ